MEVVIVELLQMYV